jgi:osmotically-inducible protein OsmY
VVTLEGKIDSAADRAEAVKIATNTEGVARVEDRLRANDEVASTAGSMERAGERADMELTDAWITTKIQSRFFADDEVKGRDIDVDTNDGVVTLKGSVGSRSERNHAVAIARSTEGVKDVREELTVSSANRETRGTSGRMNTAGAKIEDSWITTKIQASYFAAPEVKGRNINVDTRNGVVTLGGAVESPAAKEAAVQLAQETDGVTKVVDNLKIDPSKK